MSLSVLAFGPAIATPPLSNHLFHYKQWCTADAEVKVPCAENQALPKMQSFKSDSAAMEVGMFQLVPGALPYYYLFFIAVLSISSPSLSNSHSQLSIK